MAELIKAHSLKQQLSLLKSVCIYSKNETKNMKPYKSDAKSAKLNVVNLTKKINNCCDHQMT